MNCSVVQESIGPYFDDELDGSAALQIRAHLSDCEACSAALNSLRSLHELIQQGELAYTAPPLLAARIRKALRRDHRLAPTLRTWGALAATLLVASVLSFSIMRRSLPSSNSLDAELVSSHVKAMITGHTMDVVSTDRHTVKPWFNGRIDFSPPVTDLAQQGFPLVGGRIDYVDHRPVAALVYLRRKHVIDLYIWPARGNEKHSGDTSQGYNVIRWSQNGMSFAAVSDLNNAELNQFRTMLAAY